MTLHSDTDMVHNLRDWSNEVFSRRVQEGDTLWSLSEQYLGDGNKWPYLQAACDLNADPHYLLPARPITNHCVTKAREETKLLHHVNPNRNLHHHIPPPAPSSSNVARARTPFTVAPLSRDPVAVQT